MARQRYRVTGKVQGVGFRYWAHHTASSLGLLGWVRNASDGSVEVVAEGDLNALQALEKELWRGPIVSSVSEVEQLETDMQEVLNNFSIRH